MTDTKSAKETKPLVLKKDEHEIWLIDSHGDKLYKICGTQRNNMPPGYFCTNRAGYKTVHVGYGPCHLHDRQLTNPKNIGLWAKMNEKAGLPPNLLAYLEHTSILEDTLLVKVDEDIKGLYSLILYIMNRKRVKIEKEDKDKDPEGYLMNEDIELILKITDKVLKAKDLRLKLNKELTLDTTTISSFIDQMFKVIMANTASGVSKKLLAAILEEVIIPFRTQGRIKGDGKEFDLKTQQLFLEIEKEKGT